MLNVSYNYGSNKKYKYHILGLRVKYFSRKNILLLLCTLGYVLCAFFIRYFGGSPGRLFRIGSYVIPAVSLQGVFSSMQTLFCVLMVFISYQNGIVIALIASALSLANTFLPVIFNHSLSSLPGMMTICISVFILLIIYSFYKKASVNSLTDYITGLNNRRSYAKEMTERLSVDKPLSMAYIEIEDFKQINSEFGMQAGDFILQQIAKKLAGLLNKDDVLFTITGPSFAIIFNDVKNPAEVEARLRTIVSSQPLLISFLGSGIQSSERHCTVSLAAGLLHIQSPLLVKKNASAILKDAETAMLATRDTPNDKICVFDESMESAEIKQQEAEFLIREALEKDYFYLVYQPQFTTGKKELRGFEALIRCKKPDGTIVSPSYFIPVAEKTTLIMKIDDYVLCRAMTEFKPILDSMKKDCILSVNVSAKNIGSERFAGKIKKLLSETEFPPKNLEIEITEYSFADSMETTIANIQALRQLGVQIALDDFGTGYTSIAQLMKLPVNLLKIDKSLIDDIETNQTMRDMVDSVIYMGHIMNCEVISEGVENEKQIAMLKEHNCDFIQGFVWGKPQSFSDAERLCQQEGA